MRETFQIYFYISSVRSGDGDTKKSQDLSIPSFGDNVL